MAVPQSILTAALESQLRRVGPSQKVYAHFLSVVQSELVADSVRLYRLSSQDVQIQEAFSIGDTPPCAEAVVLAFARQEKPPLPMNLLLSPVRAHEGLVGVVAAARSASAFPLGAGRALNRLAWVLARELERREEERLTHVLDRIKEKVVAELRPRDLAYVILDGLHELVPYDHSASLLIFDEASSALRVEAEKIVWTKAKSSFIGQEIPMGIAQADALRKANGPLVVTEGSVLHPLFDYHRGHNTPFSRSFLCAPLFFKDELLGVLRMAAWKRPRFDAKDVRVVERFLPAAAVSLRNVRMKLSLEEQAIQAETRASLVTLARAVAHDVNNAIGAILPLTEQARDDLKEGRIDRQSLIQDLEVILEKALLCRRIFSNMLRAGADRAGSAPVDVNQLIREIQPMLEAQMRPRSIGLKLDLGEDLAFVRFSRPHLERVIWNLVTNAVEAMTAGGQVIISTRVTPDGGVSLSVTDDGPGIASAVLARVQEPFFTTKQNGTGLGLSIVRALAWQYGGAIEIRSDLGRGTEVSLTLAGASA